MTTIGRRLAVLGITIPSVNPPQGNYLSYVRTGSLIFVAGQGPRRDGQLVYKGVVGGTLGVEDGENAARICAINILSQLLHACDGDLSKIRQMVRIAGFVRCTESFEDQTRVLNAASNLICDVLGDAGKHARIASGTHALPSGMAVEIEAVAEIASRRSY
ncbi:MULTISPECIES: RidA family protein [unclassified Mesorhizobium]|uniref:RidA family protein n=1 Tax=unclassified Mesorhizobium TaxID=325217 RepID=UPI000A021AB9|nr:MULTISPECIES: RidA family protein [unclassified Mesorhizobium]WJI80961.1 RidA family protein [Mesorhizobium sp. C374B]WJI87500.1 RidA family protein [Mesorhizobium sp. C372A]